LLHPAVVEIVEVCRWIDEPLPASSPVRFLDGPYPPNKLAHHVGGLAEAGVLEVVSTTPRRGAVEHPLRLLG
jgi:hypothetical protein